MGRIHNFALIILLGISIFAAGQSPGSQPGTAPGQGGTSADNNQPGVAMAQNGTIKILSPKINERLGNSAVTLRFQLVNSGAAADTSPTYRIQLDGRDPVEVTSTEHSFTGLTDGDHVISIDLVDANHTPVPQSHTEVKFRTFTPGPNDKVTNPSSSVRAPSVVKAKWELPTGESRHDLPSGASELPLLSMVGFGVLVGGVISAMRTRR
jgi:hypothetical protein